MSHKFFVSIALISFLLAACASPAPTAIPTPVPPTATAIPTATAVPPTATPSSTPTPQPTATATQPAATPTLDANGYLGRGNELSARADYANAMTQFDTAIKLNPTLADAYLARGLAAVKFELTKKDAATWEKSAFDRALADFDQAVKIKPELAPNLIQPSEFTTNLYNQTFLLETIGWRVNQQPKAKETAIVMYQIISKLTNDSPTRQAAEKQLKGLGAQ